MAQMGGGGGVMRSGAPVLPGEWRASNAITRAHQQRAAAHHQRAATLD